MKLITNPDEFFAELKQRDVRIRVPLLTIVLPVAVIMAVYQFLLMTKFSQIFPRELAQFLMVGAYISVVSTFIGVFAAWVIIAAVMHGLSSFFGGRGEFRRTFEFVGYGFLPSLVGEVITVPMSLYYISRVELPKLTVQQIQQNPEIVKKMMMSIVPRSLVYSNLIINAAVTVWSLVLWSFAVKHAREIELKNAFICALIPTVLFGLLEIWKLIKFL